MTNNPFDRDRDRVLRILGMIDQTTQKYRDLLGRVAFIRRESLYGNPFWSDALLRAYDELGRSLQEATRLAQLLPHDPRG